MKYIIYCAFYALFTMNQMVAAPSDDLRNAIAAGDIDHVRELIANPEVNIFNMRPGSAVLLARRCLHESPDNPQRKEILGFLQLKKAVHLKCLKKEKDSASEPLTENEKLAVQEECFKFCNGCHHICSYHPLYREDRAALTQAFNIRLFASLPSFFNSHQKDWPTKKIIYAFQLLLKQEPIDPTLVDKHSAILEKLDPSYITKDEVAIIHRLASYYHMAPIITLFLNNFCVLANQNTPNGCYYDRTPLHQTICRSNILAARALLQDPRTRIDVPYKGITTLHYARKRVQALRTITKDTEAYLLRNRVHPSVDRPRYNDKSCYVFAENYKKYLAATRIAALLRMKELIQRWKQKHG